MERLLPSTINVLVAFYQQPVRVRHGSVPVTSVSYNNDAFQEVFCMQIREDNLDGPEIAEMLREHIRSAHEHSPAENAHTMDLHELRSAEITFWTVWQEQDLLGCGALKELDTKHGELKSHVDWHRSSRQGRWLIDAQAHHQRGAEPLLQPLEPGDRLDGCVCAGAGALCAFWI